MVKTNHNPLKNIIKINKTKINLHKNNTFLKHNNNNKILIIKNIKIINHNTNKTKTQHKHTK